METGRLTLKDRVEHKVKAVMSAQTSPTVSSARPNAAQLAGMIDHTLLKPEATEAQIISLCQEAREYCFAAVCVNSVYVALCREQLEETEIEIACVVGFPLGATLSEAKAYEAQRAITAGATEIDMVLNVGALRDGRYEQVLSDIAAVVQVCRARGAVSKVIIEAALLTDEEKIAACYLAQEAGADFVKTSTGFGPGGAKLEDVTLMRRTVGPRMGIKAAGGIRTYPDAVAMIGAGATRIGASAGIRIVQGARTEVSQ